MSAIFASPNDEDQVDLIQDVGGTKSDLAVEGFGCHDNHGVDTISLMDGSIKSGQNDGKIIEMDIMLIEQNEQFEMLRKILSPENVVNDDDSSSDTSTSSEDESINKESDLDRDLTSSSDEDTFDSCNDASPGTVDVKTERGLSDGAIGDESGLRRRVNHVQGSLPDTQDSSSSETCSSEDSLSANLHIN